MADLPPVTLPPATLRLRLDAAALAANWRTLDAMSGSASAGAAVKADAYGLGVDRAVPVLRDAGCRQFFVAHWSEVPAMLRHVPPGQVCVLHGVSSDAEVRFARESGVLPVINTPQQAARWIAGGGGVCHLMVDSGINRLGVSPEGLGADSVQGLAVDILLSHLASADEDCALNARQLETFRAASASIAWNRRSLANSAGIALGSGYHFDLTRPGLSLYGGIVRGELAGRIAQVAYPQAGVIQRRRLNAGDTVGYNATFTAPAAMEVATVSIGYADGFLRARGPGGVFAANGHELPVIGRVSMDMVVLDCTLYPALAEGDFVNVCMDLPREAARSGLSQYEVLTTLGRRFEQAG